MPRCLMAMVLEKAAPNSWARLAPDSGFQASDLRPISTRAFNQKHNALNINYLQLDETFIPPFPC